MRQHDVTRGVILEKGLADLIGVIDACCAEVGIPFGDREIPERQE
jgi:hypothetical protein